MQTVSLDGGHATYTQAVAYTDSEWLFHTRNHCCDVWQRFSFCSIFTSWLIHVLYSFNLLSTVKPFFFWWKFGLCTAYPCKRITNHKAKWPSVATDAQLRYRVVLLDVYWNKRKTERDWKDRAVRLIPHNSAPYSSFQGNWLWLIDDFPV